MLIFHIALLNWREFRLVQGKVRMILCTGHTQTPEQQCFFCNLFSTRWKCELKRTERWARPPCSDSVIINQQIRQMGGELTVPGGAHVLKMDAFRLGHSLTYFRMKDAWQGNSILKGAKGSLLVLSDTARAWYLQSRLGWNRKIR